MILDHLSKLLATAKHSPLNDRLLMMTVINVACICIIKKNKLYLRTLNFYLCQELDILLVHGSRLDHFVDFHIKMINTGSHGQCNYTVSGLSTCMFDLISQIQITFSYEM